MKMCEKCAQPIYGHAVGPVNSPHHERCLRCAQCKEMIRGNFYSQSDGKILCEADHNRAIAHDVSDEPIKIELDIPML